MGKNRKGYNWRARQQVKVIVKDDLPKEVLESAAGTKQQEGANGVDTNYAVLPSKKRKTEKIVPADEKRKKVLTRRQQKMQDRLRQKRIQASQRGDLIKSVQAVQATNADLKQMISVTQMQTKGLKRQRREAQRSLLPPKRPRPDLETMTEQNEPVADFQEPPTIPPAVERSPVLLETSVGGDEDFAGRDSSPEIPTDPIPKFDDESDAEEPIPEANFALLPNPFRKLHSVPVNRSPEIIEQRNLLPVTGEEQAIMEAINGNDVVIICGETGSGKTTQVPQFLYEAGYASGDGIIGITEPRRVAAMSMAKRVGIELNLPEEVSYKIRYEGTVSEKTKVKFMTDGVLMREVATDFLLKKYSVLIIDEAHERSVHSDVLLGLLSRIVPLRRKRGIPLKLIIMSATLRIQDFTENRLLFPTCPPVIKIDTRQFPVTVHYNRKTPKDNEYLQEAFKKICKIHRELPGGGILVFVTSQQEVHALCKQLKSLFPSKPREAVNKRKEADNEPEEKHKESKHTMSSIKLDAYPVHPVDEEEAQEENLADLEEMDDSHELPRTTDEPLHVLPLYSLLPSDRQARVFEPPPEGCRLCVVATNVAETSLTIPNIKYVVDTGKTKAKLHDKNTGMFTFRVMWTSQASANQRAGRCGRTSEGHCYRLYSSAVLQHDFQQFTPPEITLRPIEDLVLQMKAMNIEKTVNFPFPTPPSREALLAAEAELLELGATQTTKRTKDLPLAEKLNRITPLGRTMSLFPVAPRYAKMLALAGQHNLMPYIIAIVASLSVQEPLIELRGDDPEMPDEIREKQGVLKQLKQRWIGTGFSKMLGDIMVLLKAVGSAEYAGMSKEYCDKHCLRYKAMREIRQLRQQLSNAVNLAVPGINVVVDPNLPPPNELQCKMILQTMLSCMGGKLARKAPQDVVNAAEPAEKSKLRHAYQTLQLEQMVFLHPTSVLFADEPEFILYQEIFEGNRIYCRNIVEIDPAWIPKYIPQRCLFDKTEAAEPRWDPVKKLLICKRTSTIGPHAWPLPAVEVECVPGLLAYRWFGKFFLEGAVCPKLAQLAQHLLIQPSVMVKTWADLQPRTQSMLQALAQEEITSKKKLDFVWNKNPNYLLTEYLQWLPSAYHSFATGLWPPR